MSCLPTTIQSPLVVKSECQLKLPVYQLRKTGAEKAQDIFKDLENFQKERKMKSDPFVPTESDSDSSDDSSDSKSDAPSTQSEIDFLDGLCSQLKLKLDLIDESSLKLKSTNSNLLPTAPHFNLSWQDFPNCNYWPYEDCIRLKASENFKFAKSITSALDSFRKGHELLSSYIYKKTDSTTPKPPKNSQRKNSNVETREERKILHQFALALRITDEIFCKLTSAEEMELESIAIKHSLNYTSRSTDSSNLELALNLDKDARIVRAHLLRHSYEKKLQLLHQSKVKHSEDVHFHLHQALTLGLAGKYQEGVKVTSEALRVFTTHPEILLLQGHLLKASVNWVTLSRKTKLDDKDKHNLSGMKSSYLKFLAVVAKDPSAYTQLDHRSMPEACYSLAFTLIAEYEKESEEELKLHATRGCCANRLEGLRKNVLKYFSMGEHCESTLLPLFLPYKSPCKVHCKTFLQLTQDFHRGVLDTRHQTTNDARCHGNGNVGMCRHGNSCRSSYFSQRAPLVIEYRRILAFFSHNIKQPGMKNPKKFTKDKVTSQMPPNLFSLEELTLNEISPQVTKDYNGFFIELTVMEDSAFAFGQIFPVMTIVKDRNGDYVACYFDNVDPNDKEVRRDFGFGSTMTVMNPTFQLAVHNESREGLIVHDTQIQVIFRSRGVDKRKCRFCGGDGPGERCLRCQRALYCGKECQIQDWKMLKHKIICSKEMNEHN